MNVLSLFDGIACGKVALDRAGIKYNNYYSSEIDKHAIKCAETNHPDIIQLGGIENWEQWGVDLRKIDLIFAGFPCQSWSVAGGMGADFDPRGALVHDLIDVWRYIEMHNPKVKFLFENVKMKNAYISYMNELFGCEPILFNSSLVSAQNRNRLYWTNIPFKGLPVDRGITMENIVAWSRSTRYPKNGPSYVESRERKNGKSHTLTTGSNCSMFSSINYIDEPGQARRKLTVLECEKLQTLPVGYTAMLSNRQAFKTIGNGWTVDVIVELLQGLK